jgi:hypothetical protein
MVAVAAAMAVVMPAVAAVVVVMGTVAVLGDRLRVDRDRGLISRHVAGSKQSRN